MNGQGEKVAPTGEPSEVTCRIGAATVSRNYGQVKANSDVNLCVRPGTVHAVIGENGAGKSTLMRMLYGLERPDVGAIIINDQIANLMNAREAISQGIGLVQQELAILPGLSLLENLVLGDEPTGGIRIQWKNAHENAVALAESVGVRIDWHSDATHAPIAIQQQVEILRLIYRGADVLILDEPTAVLAPAQASDLLLLLDSLREAGRTIIFISHKLDEVIKIADDVTVLRSGRTVATLKASETSRKELAAYIIGDGELSERSGSSGVAAETVLVLENVAARDDRGIERLSDVNLTVRAGEILGVAAVAGNGQEELAEAIIGIRKSVRGKILLTGVHETSDITRQSVRARRNMGVSYVSADRKTEGLAVDLSLTENIMAGVDLKSLSVAGWVKTSKVRLLINETLIRATVRFGTAKDPAASLSGGNQQRVVIGRETLGKPKVVIASQPTRGVDIRGISYVHELLRKSRDNGAGILLFSEELDELIELADRVIVLYRGEIAGEFSGEPENRTAIGELMLGKKRTYELEKGLSDAN